MYSFATHPVIKIKTVPERFKVSHNLHLSLNFIICNNIIHSLISKFDN